jgi:hypothetical protein
MFDTTRRKRRVLALLGIALVAFPVVVPTVASIVGSAILVPLGPVVAAVLVTIVRRTALRCDEQPASLLSILDSRAPPAVA